MPLWDLRAQHPHSRAPACSHVRSWESRASLRRVSVLRRPTPRHSSHRSPRSRTPALARNPVRSPQVFLDQDKGETRNRVRHGTRWVVLKGRGVGRVRRRNLVAQVWYGGLADGPMERAQLHLGNLLLLTSPNRFNSCLSDLARRRAACLPHPGPAAHRAGAETRVAAHRPAPQIRKPRRLGLRAAQYVVATAAATPIPPPRRRLHYGSPGNTPQTAPPLPTMTSPWSPAPAPQRQPSSRLSNSKPEGPQSHHRYLLSSNHPQLCTSPEPQGGVAEIGKIRRLGDSVNRN